ncbi:TPA: hypothetical protein ACITN2_004349 [Salmonella enterica subsp. enterica serovar Virchow]
MSLVTVSFTIESEEAAALAHFVECELQSPQDDTAKESALFSLQYALNEAMPEEAAE